MAFCLSGFLVSQEISYKTAQGVCLQAKDTSWQFQVRGYLQTTGNWFPNSPKTRPSNEFFVRRAVTDFIFTYQQRFRFFLETDARGENRYEMVIAQIDIEYARGHHLVAGKYMTPFSPENHRPSRALTTVERYTALNSLFRLPAMTSQYGVMFYGRLWKFDYYLGIGNGNGNASKNIREDNSAKEYQTRLVYSFCSDLKTGLGLDYSREKAQPLGLVDHTLGVYSRDTVYGRRYGVLLEAEWTTGAWLFRCEAFQFYFPDRYRAQRRIQAFSGGYLECGRFVSGNTARGLQLLTRYEFARLLHTGNAFFGPKSVHSLLGGFNWYFHPLLRWQVNVIHDRMNQKVKLPESRYYGNRTATMVLSMLQMMF